MEINNNTLSQVQLVARQAGDFIRLEREKFSQSEVVEKGLNDLVSYVDISAEKIIVNGLKEIIPQAGFLTEEKTTTLKDEDVFWIIDPLDGTTNFIHGLPVFSVSIALSVQNELVLGVVYEVGRDEMFAAIKGQGATMNGKSICVSAQGDGRKTLVATGFPYNNFEKEEAYISLFRKFMNHTHGLRRFGSAAVDLCYVACGRFDGFFEYNLNAWDVAGGAVIVKEAGGTVSNFENGTEFIEKREILATNTKVHLEFVGFTKEFK
ncbi:MAG: myo-inositol-1(or 4)-monophosphatase [Sphingobacteriales bacterium]|jgi:myo-inositol-1(or 4)-monophosphatase